MFEYDTFLFYLRAQDLEGLAGLAGLVGASRIEFPNPANPAFKSCNPVILQILHLNPAYGTS